MGMENERQEMKKNEAEGGAQREPKTKYVRAIKMETRYVENIKFIIFRMARCVKNQE